MVVAVVVVAVVVVVVVVVVEVVVVVVTILIVSVVTHGNGDVYVKVCSEGALDVVPVHIRCHLTL